jgi:selenide,water dikinase
LAKDGVRTGASTRNWESYGEAVNLDVGLPPWRRDLLTDPQTSGGLLIAVDPAAADAVLALARREGFAAATVVGEMTKGASEISVLRRAGQG